MNKELPSLLRPGLMEAAPTAKNHAAKHSQAYLPGLNSLRFFAAFFVVISHASVSVLGVFPAKHAVAFARGADAVDFFFTLSGFLITYLLAAEIKATGTVSIRQFYLRRVYRIWPLYFLIVFLGFFILGYVYPKIYHQQFFNFSIPKGLLLFLFFLPNYAAKNYSTGLMNPLWSIGVEEQFYLFWAPLVKLFKNKLRVLIGAFIVITCVSYYAFFHNYFNIPAHIRVFLLSQKFYAMAIGAAFGYLLFHQLDWYKSSIWSNKIVQALVLGVVLWHFLMGFPVSGYLPFQILLTFFYGLLILNVSAIDNKLINIETPILSYLGVISYGIYMFHLLVDYALRMIFPKLSFLHLPTVILAILYYLALLGVSILLAGLSHKYFEKYFLALKYKLHAPKVAV